MAGLTHTQQIFLGVSKIEIAPVGTLSDTTPWVQKCYSARDSVKFTQPAATRTDLEVDQLDVPIASTYKAGVTTLEFDVPDLSKDVLDSFYTTSTPAYSESGYTTVGLSLGADIKTMMVRVTSGDGTKKLVLTNASVSANIDVSNPNSTAAKVHVTFTALAPNEAVNERPFYISYLNGTPVVLYDWVKYGTSALGAGLTDTFSAGVTTHIGVAEGKTSAVESTNPTAYKWYPI